MELRLNKAIIFWLLPRWLSVISENDITLKGWFSTHLYTRGLSRQYLTTGFFFPFQRDNSFKRKLQSRNPGTISVFLNQLWQVFYTLYFNSKNRNQVNKKHLLSNLICSMSQGSKKRIGEVHLHTDRRVHHSHLKGEKE